LSALAVPIGALSAFVAYGLLWLIAVITNFAFYHRLLDVSAAPQGNHLGIGVVLMSVVGALIIGLMARFGSEKICGHGIQQS
jgi:CIC family chloride channel protein